MARGYFQKSLVIVSHLPSAVLFSRLVNVLGPLYFDHGPASLDAFHLIKASLPEVEALENAAKKKRK